MRMDEEKDAIAQLLKHASTIVLLERVGAAPQDTGQSSSAFPGVRVLSNPSFSSSPVVARKSPAPTSASTSEMAYAKYDYKGSPAAETLTVARGEAVLLLEMPGRQARWVKCRLRDGSEEGYVPTSFLDSPLFDRAPLGRERALSRAGTTSVPASSPLRMPLDPSQKKRFSEGSLAGGGASSPLNLNSGFNTAAGGLSGAGGDPLAALNKDSVRSIEDMSDRMDILSRALVKEKEERILLEKRLEALLSK